MIPQQVSTSANIPGNLCTESPPPQHLTDSDRCIGVEYGYGDQPVQTFPGNLCTGSAPVGVVPMQGGGSSPSNPNPRNEHFQNARETGGNRLCAHFENVNFPSRN